MPFQTAVNILPAPAVVGDYASSNPRTSVLAGPGQLVAGAAGLTIGRFAWLDKGTFSRAFNTGSGAPDGFVGRAGNQALITAFLGETSHVVQPGMPCTLYNEGEFWVVNSGAAAVVPNQKAYANNTTGLATFGVTGSPPSGASVTASVAASTGSFTGSIADNILTITGVTTGVVVPGGTLSGTNVVAGTKVVEQISGTTGGVGTYYVNIGSQNAASTTISETYGTMTVTAVGSGTVSVGQTISGAGVVAGTAITALGTGTGGTGTYIVDNNTVVTSTTITCAGGTETKWYSASFAGPGELVKMTSWPRG